MTAHAGGSANARGHMRSRQAAAEGWELAFQVIEKKRYLLFWSRETVLLTLGRR